MENKKTISEKPGDQEEMTPLNSFFLGCIMLLFAGLLVYGTIRGFIEKILGFSLGASLIIIILALGIGVFYIIHGFRLKKRLMNK